MWSSPKASHSNFQDIVNPGFETGLLGLALHPDFESNGQIILSYTVSINGDVFSRISRVHSKDGGWLIDPASEEILLELAQPYSNHNGGHIAFGADGFLYAVFFGDGGSAGDLWDTVKTLFSLHGSIIRLDIDEQSPYAIPSNNPFADGQRGAPEVFAYGFRNVWRFSFDSETNTLWAGDVGQYNAEEIDRVELGGNYGWNIVEGDECYASTDCDTAGLIPPILTYPNSSGASVVMGPVYRGSDIPDLTGTPLFTDFYDGIIRAIRFDATTGEAQEEHLAESNRYISSFSVDNSGEVYVLDYYGGSILRLEPGTDDPPTQDNEVPALLSETGCMSSGDTSLPGPALIPYGVQHAFWSDEAVKQRWLALPDGEHIEMTTDGDWAFPVGTVLIKHFYLQETLVETRLMMLHEDGAWGGYSYAWREDGSDAELLMSDALRDFGSTSWSYPSRADCLKCHTDAAGGSLGLETAQLNGSFDYETTTANQLETLKQIGLIWYEESVSELPSLAPRSSDANSARSLLHVNCSGCHRPDGPGGDLDLRWSTPLQDMGACGSTARRLGAHQ